MNHKFTFHADPGHGWLEVFFSDLEKIQMTKDDFSDYSYAGFNSVFLEEDCDAPKFIEHWKRAGNTFRIVEKNYNDSCFIRDLLPLKIALIN